MTSTDANWDGVISALESKAISAPCGRSEAIHSLCKLVELVPSRYATRERIAALLPYVADASTGGVSIRDLVSKSRDNLWLKSLIYTTENLSTLERLIPLPHEHRAAAARTFHLLGFFMSDHAPPEVRTRAVASFEMCRSRIEHSSDDQQRIFHDCFSARDG